MTLRVIPRAHGIGHATATNNGKKLPRTPLRLLATRAQRRRRVDSFDI
ncbi:hypothetical protein PLANPX_2600 [Lacipirellula parvula]|uniref:Uncharacterized protein n=1 Tax=Lacipirellula parvula TaxID=2650471 RepID=A0A5K7X8X6_9BACT|nr:hypothetical protein PLANPX_2600 [Lacipirellula parvula]